MYANPTVCDGSHLAGQLAPDKVEAESRLQALVQERVREEFKEDTDARRQGMSIYTDLLVTRRLANFWRGKPLFPTQ